MILLPRIYIFSYCVLQVMDELPRIDKDVLNSHLFTKVIVDGFVMEAQELLQCRIGKLAPQWL